MKHTFISLALLSLLFTGCDSRELVVDKNDSYVPRGHSALDLKIESVSEPSSTYAVGDLLPGVATNEEKTISSLAVFVQTPEDGFFRFFSEEEEMTPNGLNKGLEETTPGTPGEYNVTVLVKGMQLDKAASRVVIVANYLENGVDLSHVTDMDELDGVVSGAFTASPVTPLLMYSSEDVQFVTDNRVTKVFSMERMVARVDIENKASVVKGGGEGFVLSSAQLLNAAEQTYLKPEHEKSGDIGVVNFPAVNPLVPGDLMLDTLYLFENSNLNPAKATVVQIKGTFKGSPVSQLIEFKKPDGTVVAVERNKRYKVEIIPAHDSTDISFSLLVKDWELGDTIQVPVVKDVPELIDLNVDAFTADGAVWDADSKTLDITKMTNPTTSRALTFTTYCNQQTAPAVAYVGYRKTYFGTGGWLDGSMVLDGEHEIVPATRANGFRIKATYTVTFQAPTADQMKTPGYGLLIVQNSQSIQSADTIRIKYVPDYESGTLAGNIKPVLVRGMYWAPVNVGATEYDVTTPVIAGDLTAKHGKLYQWGRKYGFLNTNNATIIAGDIANVAVLGWPTENEYKTVDDAGSKWFEKFIIASTTAQHGVNTQGNWLRINPTGDNPAGADMVADAWYQKLWNANEVAAANGTVITNPKKTTADPCPEGWRVPTRYEWELIGAGTNAGTWDSTTKFYKIAADNGDTSLFLPTVGLRIDDSGASFGQETYGNYWSSSVSAGSVDASYVYFSGGKLGLSTTGRAYACSVRCIQD